MTSQNVIAVTLVLCAVLTSSSVHGQDQLQHVEDGTEIAVQTFAWLPFAFYTNTFDLALGAGAVSYGYGQPQLGLAGAVFATTNSSWGVVGSASNYQLRAVKRLFVDGFAGYLHYTEKESYVPGNPAFPRERAGSNESSQENFIVGPARDGFANLQLRFLLPFGFGRDTIVNTFVLEDGILVEGSTGGWTWDPRISGRTYLGLDLFSRKQQLSNENSDQDLNTNGLRFLFEYDNRDFWINPTRGTYQSLELTRDFGWGSSSGSWTTLALSFAKYIDLGTNKHVRQGVIAIDLWTIDTLSGVAPHYEGPRLGGIYRMRGFAQNRFHDLSAVYYSAELRVIPTWSPLNSVDRLGAFVFNWWQFAAFAEIGRVAPEYSLSELHSDMKWDIGIGCRTLVKSIVLRADLAWSREGAHLTAMAGHSF
ncbi:MAG: BamA/TamA family outer membrane protein [Acidobacteriota bacterium]|jgi:hypothetical protein